MVLWRIPEQSQRVLDFAAFVKYYNCKSSSDLSEEAIESKRKNVEEVYNKYDNSESKYRSK